MYDIDAAFGKSLGVSRQNGYGKTRKLIEAYCKGAEQHDKDASKSWVNCWATNGKFEDPPGGRTVYGHDELKKLMDAIPPVKSIEILNFIPSFLDESQVACRLSFTLQSGAKFEAMPRFYLRRKYE